MLKNSKFFLQQSKGESLKQNKTVLLFLLLFENFVEKDVFVKLYSKNDITRSFYTIKDMIKCINDFWVLVSDVGESLAASLA